MLAGRTPVFSSLKRDLPASIAVFLVALPLCMGIAIASGMPVAAGLITGIVGGIVTGFLAGAPLQVSGPAAGLTVVVYEIVQTHGMAGLSIVVIAAGVLQILAGVFRLGQWFRAVSPAVIHGMLAGIGVLIFASQFHVMVDDKPKENGIRNLITLPQAIAKGLPLPATSTSEQRRLQTEVLKEVAALQGQQVALRDSIVSLRSSGPAQEEGVAMSALAAKSAEQAAINAALSDLANRVAESNGSISNPEKVKEAMDEAIRQSEVAFVALGEKEATREEGASDVETALKGQATAIKSFDGLLGQLKSHEWAAKVGIVTICVLILWQGFAPRRFQAIPGQLVAVGMASLAAFLWSLPVLYVSVPDNLWSTIRMPTLGVVQDGQLFGLLESVAILALIASAETLLCATAIDKMHTGPRTNYDRELFAQGVGNTICGLVGALPMTGVIVRSAANVQAGGKTRGSAILHGVWLILFVSLLTPVLRTIPVAALAAILVYTGYKLVNVRHIIELHKYGRSEVAIYLATLGTIVGTDLLTGVLVGIGLSAAKLLYTFAHLKAELRHDPKGTRTVLHLEGTATFLRLPLLASTLEKVPGDAELHVELEKLDYIDHACLDLLMNWAKQHEATGGRLVVDWSSLHAQFRGENGATARKSVA